MNRFSLGSSNKIENLIEEILIEYAKETIDKGNLYFVAERLENEDNFIVYEYEEDNDNVLKISSDELPEDVIINSVFRKENDKYIFDEDDTSIIKTKIAEMRQRILEEQNEVLNDYRKEGHIYIITERINDRVFLKDITEKVENEIEEVDFPEELLDKAFEGRKFKYINKNYELL